MSFELTGNDALSPIDEHFARLLTRLAGSGGRLAEIAAHTSRWIRDGHSCLDLKVLAAQLGRNDELDGWYEMLRKSPVVGRPGDWRPLILDDAGRLYLYRYWDYERRIGDALLGRLQNPAGIELKQLRARVQTLFGAADPDRLDWQRVAAATAAMRQLCVISGGPGTGKTYTVVRVLAMLAAQSPGRAPAIGLAAPTGKAAARMQEAIREAKQKLTIDDAVRDAIPESASTIHRLLGVRPNSVHFHHDSGNPLALDALVIDEASMVDLALMAKLLDALPPKARLILVGDGDQLASVEAGSVLADVCGRAAGCSAAFAERLTSVIGSPVPAAEGDVAPIGDCVVRLRESRRFRGEGGIGQLAKLINAGNADEALGLMRSDDDPDAHWRSTADPREMAAALAAAARDGYAAYLAAVADGAPAADVLDAFNTFRVLCAHRAGPAGVEALNHEIEAALARSGLIRRGQPWYPGRPVMITQNDYNLRLYNGDIGIALAEPNGELRVCFPTDDGIRRMHPARLPAHESVYAMTVHKTQGSEFDRVLLILPSEPSRVVDRRLLYTAVTRARLSAELWGREAVFRQAVATAAVRGSGLADRLWEVA